MQRIFSEVIVIQDNQVQERRRPFNISCLESLFPAFQVAFSFYFMPTYCPSATEHTSPLEAQILSSVSALNTFLHSVSRQLFIFQNLAPYHLFCEVFLDPLCWLGLGTVASNRTYRNNSGLNKRIYFSSLTVDYAA